MRTTVLTLTLAGLASDFARGKNEDAGMRIYSVLLLLVGALAGALLLLGTGLTWTILAAALFVGIAGILMLGPRKKRPGPQQAAGAAEAP